MNPLLPLDEFVPDVEPHVFEGRVYLYGSHDTYRGSAYCLDDYVCYSADVNDLTHWKKEGVIYRRTQDPANRDGKMQMFAPDVVQGNDGKYYLYYGLNGLDEIHVAVALHPFGPFVYYGIVQYPQGVEREQLVDYPANFDPSVYNDNGHIYLALGFSIEGTIPDMNLTKKNTKGAYVVELTNDMLTMKDVPTCVIPGWYCAQDTSFANHPFLEASSLRKYDNTYYFIYSSQAQHELCYATSHSWNGPYTYRGILLSNVDRNGVEDIYHNNWANNHGSLVQIKDRYYLTYHRHTCGTQFSRQVCMESIEKKGEVFITTHITTSGVSANLPAGSYPAAYACEIWDGISGTFLEFGQVLKKARIEKDAIVNITRTTLIYRYFEPIEDVVLHFNRPADDVQTRIVKTEKGYELRVRIQSKKPVILRRIEVR